MISFPAANIDDIYTEGNKSWKFNGTSWDSYSPSKNLVYSTVPPANPAEGNRWLNPDNGKLYFYVQNSWVEPQIK
jgi:hypothetical protein